VDGSYGTKGFVTNAMDALDYDYFYSCGPIPMLHALCDATNTSGEVSFEERMGCGFGACMGCTCKTKYGNKRICRDGPVLKKEEVICQEKSRFILTAIPKKLRFQEIQIVQFMMVQHQVI
jgi:dihydroorotate dehydrogenase electron transfer subunit